MQTTHSVTHWGKTHYCESWRWDVHIYSWEERKSLKEELRKKMAKERIDFSQMFHHWSSNRINFWVEFFSIVTREKYGRVLSEHSTRTSRENKECHKTKSMVSSQKSFLCVYRWTLCLYTVKTSWKNLPFVHSNFSYLPLCYFSHSCV